MEPKRKQRSNKAQIDYLCKYMQQNKEFAAGEYKTPQGAAQIERQWDQLQAALDELGPHRTLEQWKICWRDQKRKARVEGGALNKIINTTGNRGAIPELSETSAIILDTIGKEMALGCGPAESPIGFFPPTSAPKVQTAAPPLNTPQLPVTCTVTSGTILLSNRKLPLAPRFSIATPPPPPSISTTPPTPSISTTPPPPSISTTPPPPSILTLPPLPSSTTTSKPPAPKQATRRRVRARHPPDRFLNAQMELNGLIRELTNEVRRSNSLKEEQNRLLRKFCRRQ